MKMKRPGKVNPMGELLTILVKLAGSFVALAIIYVAIQVLMWPQVLVALAVLLAAVILWALWRPG